jgi:hypothetical protein
MSIQGKKVTWTKRFTTNGNLYGVIFKISKMVKKFNGYMLRLTTLYMLMIKYF